MARPFDCAPSRPLRLGRQLAIDGQWIDVRLDGLMKTRWNSLVKVGLTLGLCLPFQLALSQSSTNQESGSAVSPNPPGVRSWSSDPRVQSRTYPFTLTGENLPYAVFVSTKVAKEKKAPLIVALRGAGGDPGVFMHNPALSPAEEGGYILVAPIGYSPMGFFGMPASGRGGFGRRGGPSTNAVAPGAPAPGTNAPARGPQPGRRGSVGGTAETDPAKVSEYSEKDVMNVLAMVRREFNIDDRRIYLMGHSLGGAGALHLAGKYPSIWAAVAMLSPGAPGFQLDPNANFKDVPLLIMVGERDTLIASVRRLDEQLKSLNVAHDYREVPGYDHGGIIMGGMPEVFQFFPKYSKPEPK